MRVGCIGTVGRWLVPLVLERVTRDHPKIHVVVVDATTTSLVPQLLADRLDLAVVNLPVTDPDLVTEPLFDEDRLVVAPDGHPLAGRGRVHLTDLADHELLLEPQGTSFRDELDAEAAAAGITLHPRAEVDGLRLIATLAFQGFGAAIIPATAAPRWLEGRWSASRSTGWPAGRSAWPARSAACSPRPPGRCGMRSWGPWRKKQATWKGSTPIGAAGGVTRRRSGSHRAMPPASVPIADDHPGSLTAQITTLGGPGGGARRDRLRARAAGPSPRPTGTSSPPLPTTPAGPASRSLALISSSGADVHDGIAALHGWGTRPAALQPLLGPGARAVRGHRTRGVRPAAAARPGRPGGDDRGRLRLRVRAPAWSRRSPARRSTRPSSVAPACTRRMTGLAALVVRRPRRGARRARRPAHLPTVQHRPGATAVGHRRPRGPGHPGGRRVHPRLPHRRLRRAGRGAGHRRRRRAARAARRAGRPTS